MDAVGGAARHERQAGSDGHSAHESALQTKQEASVDLNMDVVGAELEGNPGGGGPAAEDIETDRPLEQPQRAQTAAAPTVAMEILGGESAFLSEKEAMRKSETAVSPAVVSKPLSPTKAGPDSATERSPSAGRPIDQQEAEVEEALARMHTDNDREEEKRPQQVQMEQKQEKDASNAANKVKGAEVFVGGLQRMTTEENLREMFSRAGDVVELRLMHDKAGGPKGFAFIRFTSKEAAQRAVQMHDATFVQGRRIGVTISNEQDTLFLGNLRKEWSPSDLEGLVRQTFQNVVSIELAMPPTTGESPPRLDPKRKQNRGFGFVKFTNHGAAARAYRLAQRPDFLLGGKWKPVVDWADTDPDIPEEEMAKVTTAFLGNLPKEVTEEFLAKQFEPFGPIIRVAISRKTSTPVAFVHYEERRSLDSAIQALDGTVVEIPGGPKFKLQVQLAKPAEKLPLKKRPRSDREDLRGGVRHTALRSPMAPAPAHFANLPFPKAVPAFGSFDEAFDQSRVARGSRGRGRSAYSDRAYGQAERVYDSRGLESVGYERRFGEPLRPYSREGPALRGHARGADYPPDMGAAYASPPAEGRTYGHPFLEYDEAGAVPGFGSRRGELGVPRGAFDEERKSEFGRRGEGGFGVRGVELEPYRKLQRGGSYAAGMGKYAGQAPDPYDEAINALPSPVAHKLARMFRDGVASRHDVALHILDSLRDLPEAAAATVLDAFSSMDLRAVRSKGAVLDGEVARVRRELAVGAGGYVDQVDEDWDYPPRGSNAPSSSDPPLGYTRSRQAFARPGFGLAVGSGRSAIPDAQRSYTRMERPPHNLPHEDELFYDERSDPTAASLYGSYAADPPGVAYTSRGTGAAVAPSPQFRFDPYTGEPLERKAASTPQFRIDGSGQYFIVPS